MEIPGAGPVAGLTIRPGGRHFATGTFEDTALRIFDLRKVVGEERSDGDSPLLGTALRRHTDRVTRICATDAAVVSASFDGSVRIWSFDDI
jgi:WD40 repeat protein